MGVLHLFAWNYVQYAITNMEGFCSDMYSYIATYILELFYAFQSLIY